jgi:hypothetical protein
MKLYAILSFETFPFTNVIADEIHILAISRQHNGRRPNRRPNARTRPPTRKLSFSRVPSITKWPIPSPTSDMTCQEVSPESLEVACKFFEIDNIEECQASQDLSSYSSSALIPNEVGHLTQLTSVSFFFGEGTIPSSVSCLTNLEGFYISGSGYTGTIPMSLSNLTKLISLSISSTKMQGTVPEIFFNMKMVTSLKILNNRFYGSLPSSISAMKNLTGLDISGNQFSGILPSLPASLLALEIRGSEFTGEFTKTSGIPTSLKSLIINRAKLGTIPKSLANLTRLTYLDLHSNKFKGEIPSWLSSLTNLERLILNGNKFSGTIPHDILRMRFLSSVKVYENYLVGSISSCGSKEIYVDCRKIKCTCCFDTNSTFCVE